MVTWDLQSLHNWNRRANWEFAALRLLRGAPSRRSVSFVSSFTLVEVALFPPIHHVHENTTHARVTALTGALEACEIGQADAYMFSL
jgi:hypothetical protein